MLKDDGIYYSDGGYLRPNEMNRMIDSTLDIFDTEKKLVGRVRVRIDMMPQYLIIDNAIYRAFNPAEIRVAAPPCYMAVDAVVAVPTTEQAVPIYNLTK